jgi:hypothetical protein
VRLTRFVRKDSVGLKIWLADGEPDRRACRGAQNGCQPPQKAMEVEVDGGEKAVDAVVRVPSHLAFDRSGVIWRGKVIVIANGRLRPHKNLATDLIIPGVLVLELLRTEIVVQYRYFLEPADCEFLRL